MEVSVYIHIPFCTERCHYCDFLSFAASRTPFLPSAYLDILCRELTLRGSELIREGHTVTSVYIGGGTPTFLSASELERLFEGCHNCLPLTNPEWTVEANPGTLDENKLSVLSCGGVNRISLGVQDLNDKTLALLGRQHSSAQAKSAFLLCKNLFPSVSLDIMYGLPGQSVDGFFDTLSRVITWRPDHISLYGLKTEEGTRLHQMISTGSLEMPDEDEAYAMLLGARNHLKTEGYEHYEIANYARSGKLCRHNLTYWKNRPYLGIGLGAHSYWQGRRLENSSDPEEYGLLLANGLLPVVKSTMPTRRQEMEDTMILGLRLLAGVSYHGFFKRFGLDLRDVFFREIEYLLSRELIVCGPHSIRLAERGLAVANYVFAEFIDS